MNGLGGLAERLYFAVAPVGRFNAWVATPQSRDYRLSPAIGARIMGLTLMGVALVVFAGTAGIAWLNLHSIYLLVPVLLGIAAMAYVGWRVTRRQFALRLTPEGYQVSGIRGAGVMQARWSELEDAVTTTVAGSDCVVLRLRDGRTTTIPVDALAVDKEQFARELQQFLRDGEGLKPL